MSLEDDIRAVLDQHRDGSTPTKSLVRFVEQRLDDYFQRGIVDCASCGSSIVYGLDENDERVTMVCSQLRDMRRYAELNVYLHISIASRIQRRDLCTKLFRAAFQLGLKDAKDITDKAEEGPIMLKLPGLTHEGAELLQSELRHLGVTVTKE